MILPYIGQKPVYDGYWTLHQNGYVTNYPGPNGCIGDDVQLRNARTTPIYTFYCPSDITTLLGNELSTPYYGYYRASYRGCVGSGDMYGNAVVGPGAGTVTATTSVAGTCAGIFCVKPSQSYNLTPRSSGTHIADVRDGMSETMLFSEGVAGRTTVGWGGVIGEINYGNMGGTMYSAALTPNSPSPDRTIGGCPQDVGDYAYPSPCLSLGSNAWWTPSGQGAYAAAQSRHPAGVVVAFADGAVTFKSNSIDQSTWWALATRAGGEVVTAP